jgi:hypothetical protein
MCLNVSRRRGGRLHWLLLPLSFEMCWYLLYLSGHGNRLHWCCLRCPLSCVSTLVRQCFQTSAFLAVVYDVLIVSFC